MNLASIRQAVRSTGTGWSARDGARPAPARTLFALALSLSLLPPAMLVQSASSHPLLQTSAQAPWLRIAVAFFVAQLVAFAVMGWLVRSIGARYKIDVTLRDAYLVAAVSPVPMWLSSLGLLIDNVGLTLAIGLAGFWLAEVLAFRQALALGAGSEEAVTTAFAARIVGAGLVAWALLLMLVAVLAG